MSKVYNILKHSRHYIYLSISLLSISFVLYAPSRVYADIDPPADPLPLPTQEEEFDEDPLKEINDLVAQGEALFKKAQKKRGRSRKAKKARTELYLEGLTQLSTALQKLNDYMRDSMGEDVEKHELYEPITQKMSKVLNDSLVKAKLRSYRKNLFNMLKTEDYTQALKFVQQITAVNSQDAKMLYLESMINIRLNQQ